LLPCPAIEGHISALERAVQGFTIHKPHHQYFAVSAVLHHGRQQTAQFVEIKFCIHFRFLSPKTKSPLSVCRASGPELLIIAVSSSLQSQAYIAAALGA
jgi:hypothetical protein